MFALADVVYLFTYELPGLRARGFSLPLVAASALHGLLFRHSGILALGKNSLPYGIPHHRHGESAVMSLRVSLQVVCHGRPSCRGERIG